MPFLYQTFYNFRNLKNDTIDLSPKEIFFVGENGQGKSNILESLYYAAYGISFRTHVDSQIVKNGEKNFSINYVYIDNDGVQKISIIFEIFTNVIRIIFRNLLLIVTFCLKSFLYY